MHAWINILLEHMCREVMLSGLGPLCSVHPEFSRLELALARCFTCLFIFNIKTQSILSILPLSQERKNAANKWCWNEYQCLTERNTFLLPTAWQKALLPVDRCMNQHIQKKRGHNPERWKEWRRCPNLWPQCQQPQQHEIGIINPGLHHESRQKHKSTRGFGYCFCFHASDREKWEWRELLVC